MGLCLCELWEDIVHIVNHHWMIRCKKGKVYSPALCWPRQKSTQLSIWTKGARTRMVLRHELEIIYVSTLHLINLYWCVDIRDIHVFIYAHVTAIGHSSTKLRALLHRRAATHKYRIGRFVCCGTPNAIDKTGQTWTYHLGIIWILAINIGG